MQVYGEEDGEGAKEEPKDHSSGFEFSYILGSSSMTINHKTPPAHTNMLLRRVVYSNLRITKKFSHLGLARLVL